MDNSNSTEPLNKEEMALIIAMDEGKLDGRATVEEKKDFIAWIKSFS